MTDGPLGELVSRLGPESEIGLRMLDAAASVVATPRVAGDAQEVLAAYDDALDQLLVPAVALTTYARGAGSRHVRLGVRMLAEAAIDRHGHVDRVCAALLARVVRVVVGAGLAYERPEAALALAGIPHDDATVLTASSLRHLPLFDRSANIAYESHLNWLSRRPWTRELALMRRDEDLVRAMSEADVLLAVAEAAADPSDEVYAQGLVEPGDVARRRLAARLRDPRQRRVLGDLLGADDEQLDERAQAAFARLIAQHDNGPPVRTRPLLDP